HKEDLKIFLYDPNRPNKITTMVPKVADKCYTYLEDKDSKWRTYFVDKNYHKEMPPSITYLPYRHDGLAHELVLKFTTGKDDLRGGSDNVHLTVNLADGSKQVYHNINRSEEHTSELQSPDHLVCR